MNQQILINSYPISDQMTNQISFEGFQMEQSTSNDHFERKSVANSLDLTFTSTMQELSDEQLMLKYVKGDLKAFELLYSRHKGGLYRYCLRQINHRARAEECFQEIWLKLINHRVTYQPKALFTTYLYRIAQNHVIDLFRKEKKHQANDTLNEEIHFEESSSELSDIVDTLNREKAYQELRKQIQILPAEQKTALLLKMDGGLSLEEIAVVLDCGRETIKSRLRYATKHLKAQLHQSHLGELL